MMRIARAWLSFAALAALATTGGCGSASPKPEPAVSHDPLVAAPADPAVSPVVSADILAREPLSNTASVKHILISWNDLADAFGGRIDPRAAKRTKADAEALVRTLVKQLQDGADFDTVMKASSEDTGSAISGHEFTVTPDAQLVIEFRQLALRLHTGEIGVCQSEYGFHIIKRFS